MGKPTGFIEIARQTSLELPPEERIQNFNEFHLTSADAVVCWRLYTRSILDAG